MPAGWGEIIEQSSAAERDFLLTLAASGDLPAPEYGPEVDGIPLGPSWTELRVTLDTDLDDEERQQLQAKGWTVIRMDMSTVREALRHAVEKV